jgi:hypothetical protein
VTAPARVAGALSLVLALVGVYATFIEPFRLELESTRIPLPAERAGDAPVRIGVLADLQTARVTGHERAAVDLLMRQRPDLILLPGDVFQGSDARLEAELPALRELLARLQAPAGVFCVLGNIDEEAQLERILEGTGIRRLRAEPVRLELADRRLTLRGIDHPAAARSAIEALEAPAGSDDIRILVSHYPDAALALGPGTRVDLVVAGHTHGGQVVLPGFGPPVTLSDVPRRVAAGGYHRLGDAAVYVSRGVGCERGQAPRIRFLCPPEVSLLELD